MTIQWGYILAWNLQYAYLMLTLSYLDEWEPYVHIKQYSLLLVLGKQVDQSGFYFYEMENDNIDEFHPRPFDILYVHFLFHQLPRGQQLQYW